MSEQQLDLFSQAEIPESIPCPIMGRRVVVAGEFPRGRQNMKSTLLRLGAADVRFDKPQRSTHFLVVGDNPPVDTMEYYRLYRHDGYNIRLLYLQDIQSIQDGNYRDYQVPETVGKQLRLNRDEVYWTPASISGHKSERLASPLVLDSMSELYGREIFVHPSISKAHPQLCQQIGNLGGYANDAMADDTDSIVVPASLPREILQDVEDYYNASRAQQFNIPFIILEDLLQYIEKRKQ